jgi:hypothetical protein
MTSEQLIAKLQSWQNLHRNLPVYGVESLTFDAAENPGFVIAQVVLAEEEDGTLALYLTKGMG